MVLARRTQSKESKEGLEGRGALVRRRRGRQEWVCGRRSSSSTREKKKKVKESSPLLTLNTFKKKTSLLELCATWTTRDS